MHKIVTYPLTLKKHVSPQCLISPFANSYCSDEHFYMLAF